MDQIAHYRKLIREIIEEYATHKPSRGEVQIEVIFDEAQDHYELIFAGWNGPYRIHGAVLHFDIRGGKIWIQHDGTEEGIADRLVAAGVPKDRIVLAFKPPAIRPQTGFASS